MRGGTSPRPTPSAMLKNGRLLFPVGPRRRRSGAGRPVRENASMAALDLPDFSRRRILQRRGERRIVQGIVDKLQLRPPQIERAVASFSGGNRQKILLARGLTRDISRVSVRRAHGGHRCRSQGRDLRADEGPVGDRRCDRAGLLRFTRGSPFSHRLYVMHRSRMAAELLGADINEPAVLSHFFREQHADDGRTMPRETVRGSITPQ